MAFPDEIDKAVRIMQSAAYREKLAQHYANSNRQCLYCLRVHRRIDTAMRCIDRLTDATIVELTVLSYFYREQGTQND